MLARIMKKMSQEKNDSSEKNTPQFDSTNFNPTKQFSA